MNTSIKRLLLVVTLATLGTQPIITAAQEQEATTPSKIGKVIGILGGSMLLASYPVFSACARYYETFLQEFNHILYHEMLIGREISDQMYIKRMEIRNLFWVFEQSKYASIPAAAFGAFILYKLLNQQKSKSSDRRLDIA